MNFDLPIIGPEAKPEFTDAASCAEWLQSLPLINVGPSHGRLLGELEELNCFNAPPAERLRVLELLREPVLFVQTEHAKKFTSRPVPLAKNEREIFNNVMALWDALGYGYQHCMQALESGAAGLGSQKALVCQRALWCVAQKMADHYRAYLELDEEDWRLAHRIYAFAEERNLESEQVVHPVYKGELKTSCTETYLHTLLFNQSNPGQFGPRQQALLSRWLDRWAYKAILTSRTPPMEAGLAPLSVDLAGDKGPVRGSAPGKSVRFIDMEAIDKDIRSRVALLRKGETPASLQLGEEVSPQMAESLLVALHRQWCGEKQARATHRRPSTGEAHVCAGITAMHYYVSGQPFRQPVEAKELSKTQRDEIATFGRLSTRDEDEYSRLNGFTVEKWKMREESLTGLLIERAETAGSARYLHSQLIAVHPADAKTFLVGAIRSLTVSAGHDLVAEVRTIPGVPQAVAIRATGLNAMSDKFIPALLLPEIAALQSPLSLILPAGWFRPKRVIEVFENHAHQVMLVAVLERGSDFERVTFTSV
jgi:hypothetical protein